MEVPGATAFADTAQTAQATTYFSISFSFSTSKVSSQPTSTSTLMPPSNSSNDCDAGDADCAPKSGVKVNMLSSVRSWLRAQA
jgi:hypothetical protein